MRLFTVQQVPSWQKAILDQASRSGELGALVWFVQMVLPAPPKSAARTMTQAEREAYRYRTASWPGAWVPYVEVAPDPVRSRVDAELLAGLFAAANPRSVTFVPALALREELAAVQHYEYGREWDHVCSRCGTVFQSPLAWTPKICAGCEHGFYRMAMQ
jgi:hypothetical protein